MTEQLKNVAQRVGLHKHEEAAVAEAASGVQSTKPAEAPASSSEPKNLQHINKLNKIIKGTHTCMFTTLSKAGIHARPMATAGLDFETGKGEHVYFVTERGTTKVEELKRNPAVALVFSNDANRTWATLSANAEVIDDETKARELWVPIYNAYFPGGPASPNLVLIKATPHVGTYWEGKLGNKANV